MHIIYFLFVLLLSFPVCAGGAEPLPSFTASEFALHQEMDELGGKIDPLFPSLFYLDLPQNKAEFSKEDEGFLSSFAPLSSTLPVSPLASNTGVPLTDIKALRTANTGGTSSAPLGGVAANDRKVCGLGSSRAQKAKQKKLSYVPLTQALAEVSPGKKEGGEVAKLTVPGFIYHLKKEQIKSVLEGVKTERSYADILKDINKFLIEAGECIITRPTLMRFVTSARKVYGFESSIAKRAMQKKLSYVPLTQALREVFPGKKDVEFSGVRKSVFFKHLDKEEIKGILQYINSLKKPKEVLKKINTLLSDKGKKGISLGIACSFVASARDLKKPAKPSFVHSELSPFQEEKGGAPSSSIGRELTPIDSLEDGLSLPLTGYTLNVVSAEVPPQEETGEARSSSKRSGDGASVPSKRLKDIS